MRHLDIISVASPNVKSVERFKQDAQMRQTTERQTTFEKDVHWEQAVWLRYKNNSAL